MAKTGGGNKMAEEVRSGLFCLQTQCTYLQNQGKGTVQEHFKITGHFCSYALDCSISLDRPKNCYMATVGLKITRPQENQHFQVTPEVDEDEEPLCVWSSIDGGPIITLLEETNTNSCPWKTWNSSPIGLQNRITVKISVWMDFGLVPHSEKRAIKNLSSLLSDQSLCDVTFTLRKDGTTIRAHGLILSAGSPVFATMFNQQGFQEAQTRTVNIEDIELKVFQQLLDYLYSGRAPRIEEAGSDEEHRMMVEQLFLAADKYGVDGLKNQCSRCLYASIKVDNAIHTLVWAHVHSVGRLYEATMTFVVDKSKEIFFQSEWKELIKSYSDISHEVTQRLVLKMST